MNLKSLLNQTIVNFTPKSSRFISKNQTFYWKIQKTNKYRLINLKKIIPKIPHKNQLKLINNLPKRQNKYRVINKINSNRCRNETNTKIILAKLVLKINLIKKRTVSSTKCSSFFQI